MDKSPIDTGAVYLLDSVFNIWETPNWRVSNTSFIRFFPSGQVLFASCEGIPTIDNINNQNIGTPGYYIVKDGKIKIDMFQNLNGGQTGEYFGRIRPNGDLIFYEQRPETHFSSFYLLEQAERKKRFSVWKKIKVSQMESYRPDW